jgi:hypothetical protein
MSYWVIKLNKNITELDKFLSLATSKYVDGFSRNIHYSIIHKFLYTRSKQSHINDMDPHCKFCRSINVYVREDIFHCIIQCPRVQEFWAKLNELVWNIENKNITDTEKIFGFVTIPPNKTNDTVLNLLLQVGQKCIWQTRYSFEQKAENINVWEKFRKDLHTLIAKLYNMLPYEKFFAIFLNTRVVRIWRNKPVFNFV